jgi:acyl-coenzyme A thioesterase PaaI-like protein
LPFNLLNETWGKAIARQLDKNASSVTVDSVGAFLRARITVDATKPFEERDADRFS